MTFLMFKGEAEAALGLYAECFASAQIGEIQRHGADSGEMAGRIWSARLSIGGHRLVLHDSPATHDFTFTPATSLFVDMGSAEGFETALAALARDGRFLMPPDDYGFSRRFAWVEDRFGVSWQLNLP